MGHMLGSVGAGIWMLLWWLIGLGVLFFVIYEATYMAVSRALREYGVSGAEQRQTMRDESQPPSAEA